MTKKAKDEKKRDSIIAAARARAVRRRRQAERLRQLMMLILLLNLLDSAKILGATVAGQIISNLSRPRRTSRSAMTEADSEKTEEGPRLEYTPAPGRQLQLYFGRYFERRPELSLVILYLELPRNVEVFQFLLTQLPEETHNWARSMFAETGSREFKNAARGHTISEVETIKNMQLAAQRWEWQQQQAIHEKKLELRKKFNADKEPEDLENQAYNPRV